MPPHQEQLRLRGDTYNVESHVVRQLVEDRRGLPFLQIETDYSESDTERLRVRIEAFLELMQ